MDGGFIFVITFSPQVLCSSSILQWGNTDRGVVTQGLMDSKAFKNIGRHGPLEQYCANVSLRAHMMACPGASFSQSREHT